MKGKTQTSKGYTDKQLMARRLIKAAYTWLQKDWDSFAKHKERRMKRGGHDLKSPLAPVDTTPMNVEQRAGVVQLTFKFEFGRIFVRPEQPTSDKSVMFDGKPKTRSPLSSEIVQTWATRLLQGELVGLT